MKHYVVFHRFNIPFCGFKEHEGWRRTEWMDIDEMRIAANYFYSMHEEFRVIKCVNGDNQLIREYSNA